MNRRFLAAWVLAGAALTASLTACGGSSHSVPRPTSSAALAAESALTADVTACQPDTESRSAWEISLVASGTARTALVNCLKIPAGPKRTAFYSCLLDGLKSALKALGMSARESKFVSASGTCLKTARG